MHEWVLCDNVNVHIDTMLNFDVNTDPNVDASAKCEQTFSHQEYRFWKNTGALWHFAGPSLHK